MAQARLDDPASPEHYLLRAPGRIRPVVTAWAFDPPRAGAAERQPLARWARLARVDKIEKLWHLGGRHGRLGVIHETMDLGLKDKTALVTGGSKGVGLAVARGLAAEGARVMICARDPEGLGRAAGVIKTATGREAQTVAADLSELRSVVHVVATAVARLGRIDILVNNAGAIQGGDFLATPDEEWIRAWSLKPLGYIRMAREVLPHMQRQGGGRIINVIGAGARNPPPTFMMGGTANAGLVNFTKALADLGAPSRVLVTGVSPGPVKTERSESYARQQAAATGRDFETYVREQRVGLPLGRIALPEEVADLVCFLASERASFLTGITITVDGGMTRGVYL